MKFSGNKDSRKKTSFVLKKEEGFNARANNNNKYKSGGLSFKSIKKTETNESSKKLKLIRFRH